MFIHILGKITVGSGLPIRDCLGRSNNLAPMCPKLNTIHVTAKAFFERFYLVPGLRRFLPFVTMPSATTLPPLNRQLFLDIRAK